MNRIASVMVMHARDRVTWFFIPLGILGTAFAICLFIAVFLVGMAVGGTYTGALSAFFFVMLVTGIGTITGTFPFAVGFGIRRRDYFLGTLSMAVAVSVAWAILLGLFSLVEASVIPNWGINLHFFHLPFFSDGSPLRQFCWTSSCSPQSDPNYFSGSSPLQQFWVYFVLLLFLSVLGLLVGSIYLRLGRIGIYAFSGAVLLFLSGFLLVSSDRNWWGAIFSWFARQTAAGLGWWLVPLIALFALASYALLRKASV